jgi:osmotically-inducible protein OsmY
MPRFLIIALTAAVLALTGCQKNPKLGTVAVDLYIHPESASSQDLMLQTAIRRKLEADATLASQVQVRVVELQAVLTGNVAKKDASDKAEQIARATKVTVDSDAPIVAKRVTNLVKVGN